MKNAGYRGKEANMEVWKYGWFSQLNRFPCIACDENTGQLILYRVFGETVGQYTNFDDKEGFPIFEGDIVELELEDGEKRYLQAMFKKVEREIVCFPTFVENIAKVEIYGAIFSWQNNDLFPCVGDMQKMKIVGNIYDNPELLEQ